MIPIFRPPGLHVGSPCNFKRVRVQRQRAKGGRGAGFMRGWGGGDLTQPPANFSKFLVDAKTSFTEISKARLK